MLTICVRHASLLHLEQRLMQTTPIPFNLFEKMLVRCEWPHVDGGGTKTFKVWGYLINEDFGKVEDYFEKLFGCEYRLDEFAQIPKKMNGVVAVVFPREDCVSDATFRELFGATSGSVEKWGVDNHWVVLQHSVNHRGNKSFIYFE
jgi:hypothetical protein